MCRIPMQTAKRDRTALTGFVSMPRVIWYTDADGRRYYLNPVSDNTKGRMVTGWNWIGGNDRQLCCYYFQEISDGYRGSLFKDGKTPDGYFVNSQGEWIVEKQVQKK